MEEQFYLLFPAALVLIWKWRPKALLPAIFALLALSFALAVLAAPQEPRLAFYMLPTRMWELMAGAACALSPPLRRGRNVASLAGLAIIVAGLLVIDSETPAPGLLFALPVGGTTLVLLAAGQDTRAGRLLAFRPMVLLGLISYGTYLWHQPILAFLHYVWFGPAPLIATVGAVLASLALGWLSWVLIERPVRRKSVLASPASLAALCIGCLALAVSLGVAGHFRAVEPRSGAGDHKLGASYGGGNVDDALIPRGGALPFILYGDSHARQYYPALVERFGRGALLSKDGCLSLPGMTNWPRGSENAAACAAHAGSLARLLRERGTKRVIVAQRWDRAMWDTRSGAALGRTSGPAGPELLTGLAWLRASLPARTGLVLMGNAPTAWAYGPQMQRGYLRCQAYLNVQCPADYPASMAEGRKVNALLRQFAADHPGTAYLDAAAPLCPGGRCRIISDGRLYYSDGSHLTLTAARLVVARLPAPRPLP